MDTNKDASKQRLGRSAASDNKVVFHQRRQSIGIPKKPEPILNPDNSNNQLKFDREIVDNKKTITIMDIVEETINSRNNAKGMSMTNSIIIENKTNSMKLSPVKIRNISVNPQEQDMSIKNPRKESDDNSNQKSRNSVGDKRKSLYNKLQDSLKSYILENKKEVVLQGNKRFTGKTGEYYLMSNNLSKTQSKSTVENLEEVTENSINETKPDQTSLHNSVIVEGLPVNVCQGHTKARDMIVDSFKDRIILKQLNIDPKTETKITTAVINKKKDNLTPIPSVKKDNLENTTKISKLINAERTAVQIRRLEYSYGMKVNKTTTKISMDYDYIKIAKCVRIQRWWRYLNRRNKNIIIIQASYRSFRVRKKFFDLLDNANEIMKQLNEFKDLICRTYMRKTLSFLHDLYEQEQNKKKLLKSALYLQPLIRKFLEKLKIKRRISFTIIIKIFASKRKIIFNYLINSLKQKNASAVIKVFLKKYKDNSRLMCVLSKRLHSKLNKLFLQKNFKNFIAMVHYYIKLIKIKNMILNVNEKNNFLKLKHYLKKLKKITNLLKNKETVRGRVMTYIVNRKTKKRTEKLRKCLFKWLKYVVSMDKIYRNSATIEKLIVKIKNLFRRRYIKNIFNCFKNKIKNCFRTTKLKTLLKSFIRKKVINHKFESSKYFNKWKSTKSSSIRNKLFNKIIKQITKKQSLVILRKSFKLWLSLKNESSHKRERSLIMKRFFDLAKGINLLTKCIRMIYDKNKMFNNLIKIKNLKRRKELLFKNIDNIIKSDNLILKIYFKSWSKYSKSCLNREKSLKNSIKKISYLMKQSLKDNFHKWEISTEKIKNVIKLEKIPLVREFINKIQLAMIKNILTSGFMDYYMQNEINKKFSKITKNKHNKNLSLIKKKFERWIKNIAIKKSNQKVANELMKRMFNLRDLSNLLMKKLFHNSEVFNKLNNYGINQRKNKILSKIILQFFPLQVKTLLNKFFTKWSNVNKIHLAVRDRLKIILKEVIKNNTKITNLKIKPFYLLRWKENSKVAKLQITNFATKKLCGLISEVFYRNLINAEIFEAIDLKARNTRTDLILKSRVKKVDKKNNINKKSYFNIWKRNILKIQIARMSDRFKSRSLKRVFFKSMKNCLTIYFKKWKKVAREEFINNISKGSKILETVINGWRLDFLESITINLLKSKKFKSLKKVNKLRNNSINTILNKHFNIWNRHLYQDKAKIFSSLAIRKMLKYILMNKHINLLKIFITRWHKNMSSKICSINQSISKAFNFLLNHSRRRYIMNIIQAINNAREFQKLKNLIKKKSSDDKQKLKTSFNQFKNKIFITELSKIKHLKNVFVCLGSKNRLAGLMKYFNKYKNAVFQNFIAMNLANRVREGIKLTEFVIYNKYFHEFFYESKSKLPLPKFGHEMNSITARNMNRKNLAKVLSIREIFFRRHLRLWRSQVTSQKGIKLIVNLLESLKKKFNKLTMLEFKNSYNSRLDSEIYKNYTLKSLVKTLCNNNKDTSRIRFKQWKSINLNLKNLNKIFNNFIKNLNNKTFQLLNNHILNVKEKNFALLKISCKLNKKNIKENLNKYFNRWLIGIYKNILRYFRIKMLSRVMTRYDKKYNEKKNILKKYFNNFMRKICFVKMKDADEIFVNLAKYKNGSEILRKYLCKQKFPIINQFIKNRSKMNSLKNCINLNGKILKRNALKQEFNIWLNESRHNKLAEEKFNILSNSKNVFKRLDKNLISELSAVFKILIRHINNSALKIQNFYKNRKNSIKLNMKDKLISSILSRYSMCIDNILIKNFIKWKKVSVLNNISHSSLVIQSFIRNILKNKLALKRVKLTTTLNVILTGHFHKLVFSNLKVIDKKIRKNRRLASILVKTNLKNDTETLLIHLKKWFDLNILIKNKSSLMVTNALRNKQAFMKRENLFKLKLIKKIYSRFEIANENLFKICLLKWKSNSYIIRMINDAGIIQTYLLKKMNKLRHINKLNTLKNLFKRGLQSNVTNVLFNLKNQNKKNKFYCAVFSRLTKFFFQLPFTRIKSFKNLEKFQLLLQRKYLSDKERLGFYLNIWENINNINKNNAAVVLARNFRKFAYYKKTSKMNKLDDTLFKLLCNLTNKGLNKRKKTFYIWLYKTNLYKINESVTKVQNKFRQINSKKRTDNIKFCNLINNFYSNDSKFKLLEFAKIFKLVKSNTKKFLNRKNMLKIYITNNLIKMNNLFSRNKLFFNLICNSVIKESKYQCQKYFNVWKIRSQNLFKYVISLQSAFRGLIARMQLFRRIIKNNRIKQLIKALFTKVKNSNNYKFKGSFKRFKHKTLMMQLIEKAEKIQNKFRCFSNRQKGKKLIAFYKIYKFGRRSKLNTLNDNFIGFYSCYQKLKSFIINKKRKVLNKFKIKIIIRIKLQTIYSMNCKKNRENMLSLYLNKWNDDTKIKFLKKLNSCKYIFNFMRLTHSKIIKSKMNRKRELLMKYLSKLDVKDDLKFALYYSRWFNISLSDRVKYSAEVIQKFIRNKRNKMKRALVKKLNYAFRRIHQFTDEKHKNIFAHKLFKIYIYKILKKNLVELLEKKIKNLNIKDLFNNIKSMFIGQVTFESRYKYSKKKRSYININPKELFYKNSIQNIKKTALVNSDRISLIMGKQLNEFLNNFILKRKNFFIKALSTKYKMKKLLDKFNSAESVLKKLFNRRTYNKIINSNLSKKKIHRLKILFRKYSIKCLNDASCDISRFSRLCYLVKVTLMNKELSKFRFITEILRRWRFSILLKKMAKNKLGVLYKNMHLMYLNFADELFGDNPESMKHLLENMGDKFGFYDPMDMGHTNQVLNFEISKAKRVSSLNSSMEFNDHNSTGYTPAHSIQSTYNVSSRNSLSKLRSDRSPTDNIKFENKNNEFGISDEDYNNNNIKSIKLNFNPFKRENLNNTLSCYNSNEKPEFVNNISDLDEFQSQNKDYDKDIEPGIRFRLKTRTKPILNPKFNKKK